MRRILALAAMLLAACQIPPRGGTGGGAPGAEDGTGAYAGAFAEYATVRQALENLSGLEEDAAALLRERLGLDPDPLRPRRFVFSDEAGGVTVRTTIEDGLEVQEIVLPAAAIAQGRADAPSLVVEGLCRAALTDRGRERLPAWYRIGAPVFVSGGTERALYEAVLGGPAIRTDAVRIARGNPFSDPRPEPLACALLFRFLAEEFGADRLRNVGGALEGRESAETAMGAALETDVAALPVAFDGYFLRIAGETAEDRIVRELAAARPLPPAERALRLSGLAGRAPNSYVAAAVLEDLGLALFETERWAEAAETFARVEREYPRHALHLDRDRLCFALCFARQGEKEAAALRLDAFLAEFPGSAHAPTALFESAVLLLDLARTEDAMSRYREVAERHPASPHAPPARVALGDFERARHRYGAARRHFLAAGVYEPAAQALAAMDAELAGGLPPAAAGEVSEALAALDAEDETARAAAADFLGGVGGACGTELSAALAAGTSPRFRRGAAAAVSAWNREEGDAILLLLLGDADAEVAAASMDGLLGFGMRADELRSLIESHPAGAAAAREEWERRFGGASLSSGEGREDYRSRIARIHELAGRTDEAAREEILVLAGDWSPQVRREAVAALAAQPIDEWASALREALGDTSPLVRLEAVRGLGRHGRHEELRARLTKETDGRVVVAACAFLLDSGEEGDAWRVLSLLSGEPSVATAVEGLLRDTERRQIVPLAAAALEETEDAGPAMRLVRVLAAHAGTDFGYDPGGGEDERRRVAAAALAWYEMQGR